MVFLSFFKKQKQVNNTNKGKFNMGLHMSNLCFFCKRDDTMLKHIDTADDNDWSLPKRPQCSDCGKAFNKSKMICYRCKHQFSVFQRCRGRVCSNVIIPQSCPRCDSQETIAILSIS